MQSKRIVVLTNSGSFDGFLIDWLSACWRDAGFEVAFKSDMHLRHKEDLAILHVDATEVPTKYLDANEHYSFVVNGNTTSISKDLFSESMLNEDSEYDGAVIVKTLQNYGGLPEFSRAGLSRSVRWKAKLIRTIALSDAVKPSYVKSAVWRRVEILDPANYPVFQSLEKVPAGVWKNPRLMVEKFLPERLPDGRHALRHWYFLGNREFCRTLVCKSPIPKWASMDAEERTRSRNEWFEIEVSAKADVPQEVRAVRDKLKMDYGRIDWALHQGKAVIYDANKTPSGLGAVQVKTDLDRKRYSVLMELSQGIGGFITTLE